MILCLLFAAIFAQAQTDFFSDCQTMDQWQSLDMKGDGQFHIIEDVSVPPGYGPNVIEMAGDNVLLFAKDQKCKDGTLVVLWKDVNPQKKDADGILMFRADFPADLSYIHNVKKIKPQYWFEQDFDSGASLRYRDEKTQDVHLDFTAGKGLTYDTAWNPTGWMWQKVKLQGEKIFAKYWSVTEPEPEKWLLQATSRAMLEGRFGVRAWSGEARIAWFKASSNDVTVEPPHVFLFAKKHLVTDGQIPDLTLYTNLKKMLSGAEIRLIIKKNGTIINQERKTINIPTGSFQVDLFSKEQDSNETNVLSFDIPENMDDGEYELECQLAGPDGQIVGSDKRKIEIRSNKAFMDKIAHLSAKAKDLSGQSGQNHDKCYKNQKRQVSSRTAQALLELAKERINSGEQDGAQRAVEYAEQMILNSASLPHGQQHGGTYSIRFGDVKLSSESLVLGQTYELVIPWIVTGKKVDRDYTFRYHLCDEYGKTIHSLKQKPSIPTSKWEPGVHEETISFSIPFQIPPHAAESPDMPEIFTGPHHIAVSVHDSQQKGGRPWTLLDNPEAIHFFNVGRLYTLKQVYVTVDPFEISKISLPMARVLQKSALDVAVKNISDKSTDLTCVTTITSVSGKVLFQSINDMTLASGEEKLTNMNWTPNYAGDLTVTVRIIRNGITLTHTSRLWRIPFPEGMTVDIERENHVVFDKEFYTPLQLDFTCPDDEKVESWTTSVFSENEKLFQQTDKLEKIKGTISKTINVRPNWGYYDILCRFDSRSGSFSYEKRVVSTVVETNGTTILVNGEPFIMKGTNVHGLWGNSREITNRSMEIMKEYGYNTLRGDHPGVWLVDLAHENNLCWMALNEFSCAKAEDIYARFESDPLGGAQEVTRQFIIAYHNHAGVLFWNSCNEIDNELDEFLLTLYPCFGVYDAYGRPVNYANLYGQDNWRGQDIMGINYYFGWKQHATDRQPIIQRSVELGINHNLPVIYTEYNSFGGPDEAGGVEAIEGMGQFGLDIGMAGGTFYKLLDVTGKHPGLLDPQSRLQIRIPLGDAIKAFHADAIVSVVERAGNQVVLQVQNRRNFTLRQINLNLCVGNENLSPVTLDIIKPKETRNVSMNLPENYDGQAIELIGDLRFETHFGLLNKVNVDVFSK